jgi:hypothetical protein
VWLLSPQRIDSGETLRNGLTELGNITTILFVHDPDALVLSFINRKKVNIIKIHHI